jgi:hypothetical protein
VGPKPPTCCPNTPTTTTPTGTERRSATDGGDGGEDGQHAEENRRSAPELVLGQDPQQGTAGQHPMAATVSIAAVAPMNTDSALPRAARLAAPS